MRRVSEGRLSRIWLIFWLVFSATHALTSSKLALLSFPRTWGMLPYKLLEALTKASFMVRSGEQRVGRSKKEARVP